MGASILYEVNTRVWLRELSERAGEVLRLDTIPDEPLAHWRKLGFTHIWLMGVWSIGPKVREQALEHWRNTWSEEIPSTETDVHGSPYAISDYSIDTRLGEPLSLLFLRDRFQAHGLKLILDFIPNHLGIDAREPYHYPQRFVQSTREEEGFFQEETKFGSRFFAHGRDPYFPPWEDTIQLDYRVPDTQANMSAVAQTASVYCDGLRCDMSMLLLPEIFRETWKEHPPVSRQQAPVGFWNHAINAIKQTNPGAELIAEAYWGKERELQEAGFDFTYNKSVTDMLVRQQYPELRDFLLQCAPEYLARSIHFLENHDEPRAAAVFPNPTHKAAALLILALPGMPLLHDGQLEGRKAFARIQMNKRLPEEPDLELQNFYVELLAAIKTSRIRNGKAEILAAEPVLDGDSSFRKTNAIQWCDSTGKSDLILINFGDKSSRVKLPYRSTPVTGIPKMHFCTVPTANPIVKFERDILLCELPPLSGGIWRFDP